MPLLPADLLRNFIFLRAARLGEAQDRLYEKYWRQFDDAFWREEVQQGRLLRPRSDLYIQHFLASKLAHDIPIKHLFVEYRNWIDRGPHYASVEDELATLARQGEQFRRILEPKKEDVLYPLVTFLDRFDIRTAYPLLLHLLEEKLPDEEWEKVGVALESYLLRRAICGLTTQGYNRVFLALTKALRNDGSSSSERICEVLAGLKGESTEWPRDEAFQAAWSRGGAYQVLQPGRLAHVFQRLSERYMNVRSEAITIESPLTIEHLMPQAWVPHWPLAGGVRGLTERQLEDAAADDPVSVATRRRNALVHSIGNLTIVTQELNSSVSNAGWETKRPAILAASLLPINLRLAGRSDWDEEAIVERSEELFQLALKIWPGPRAMGSEREAAGAGQRAKTAEISG